MKYLNQILLAIFSFLLAPLALADDSALVTSAVSAVNSAKSDALTVGGAVVATVAALIVVGLIIAMVRKT